MRRPSLIGRLGLGVGVTVAAVVLDVLTKRYAAGHFRGRSVEVIPHVLSFTFTENPGSAFSIFRGGGPLLAVAAVAAVFIAIGAIVRPRPLLEVAGFGLIMAGAVGNLVDRVARGPGLLDGQVIDWIRFPHFPVFNLADSSITVGVVLLLIAGLRQR